MLGQGLVKCVANWLGLVEGLGTLKLLSWSPAANAGALPLLCAQEGDAAGPSTSAAAAAALRPDELAAGSQPLWRGHLYTYTWAGSTLFYKVRSCYRCRGAGANSGRWNQGVLA